MSKRKNKIKVIYRKLGRYKVWGLCYKNKNIIEIEERTSKKLKLRILCHELIHKIAPEFSESRVLKAEKIIGNTLWEQNYRKVDQ